MSATPQLPPVAKLEQKTVVDLVTKGKRIDERGLESYRPIQIQVGLIEKANGSAQVFLGKSKVLAGIKVEIGEPFPDTPEEGVLTVNAELVPLASPSFEMRSEEHTSELQSQSNLVCRLLLEKKKKYLYCNICVGIVSAFSSASAFPFLRFSPFAPLVAFSLFVVLTSVHHFAILSHISPSAYE